MINGPCERPSTTATTYFDYSAREDLLNWVNTSLGESKQADL